MSEKKNIDKLFKEQLKDFEQAPNDIVWQRIEEELHKDKRKRRVIPIWWKLAGVAAILALMFTVGNLVLNNDSNNTVEKEIVDSEQEDIDKSKSSQESSEILNKEDSRKLSNSSEENTSKNNDNSTIASQDNSSELQPKETPERQFTNTNTSEENKSVVSSNRNVEEQRHNSNIDKNKSQIKNAVAQTNSSNVKAINKKQNGDKRNSQSTNTVANTSEEATQKVKNATSIESKEKSEIDQLIKNTKQSKETQVTTTVNLEQEKAISAIDSSATEETIKEDNAIENAIAEAEKEKENKEEEETIKRWSIAPNVAPVYFNTLGKGSSLDNQFVENTKEGSFNVSYGLKGSYALGKKLKIRAGVNKVDLGYSTNNVLSFESGSPNTSARQIQNVQLNDSLGNTYLSASSLSFSNAPELLFAKERGSIEQQLGFIEVPIELEYSLVDKKFGLNVIGGFSTLFLNNNEIYSVENNGTRTLLGEATNIKDMSYSANFGVGINYNISKQLRFNLEPTFKYQINTFSNTSGDFQPFFVGVYTGLSFKF